MIAVYAIYNKIKGKYYIGSTTNYEKRIECHLKSLCNGTHSNKMMQKDYNNLDDFQGFLLKELNTETELESWENYFIGRYNSIENGYNTILARRPRKPLVIVKEEPKEKVERLCKKQEVMDTFDLTEKEFDDFINKGMPALILFSGTKRFNLQSIGKWIISQKGE